MFERIREDIDGIRSSEPSAINIGLPMDVE